MQEIRILILPNGKIQIETKGFKGKGCVDATNELEKMLGLSDKIEELTSEYFQQEEKQGQPLQQS